MSKSLSVNLRCPYSKPHSLVRIGLGAFCSLCLSLSIECAFWSIRIETSTNKESFQCWFRRDWCGAFHAVIRLRQEILMIRTYRALRSVYRSKICRVIQVDRCIRWFIVCCHSSCVQLFNSANDRRVYRLQFLVAGILLLIRWAVVPVWCKTPTLLFSLRL